jgi:hypothetical protein
VEIMDLNGKTVASSTSELLRLNDVENGMYVLHIRSGSKQVTRKLVINR